MPVGSFSSVDDMALDKDITIKDARTHILQLACMGHHRQPAARYG